jgi:hypothetical protein
MHASSFARSSLDVVSNTVRTWFGATCTMYSGRWAGRPESDDCCVGADFRPEAEGYLREAAIRTAELGEKRRDATKASGSSVESGGVAAGGGGGDGDGSGGLSGDGGARVFDGIGSDVRIMEGGSAAAAAELRRHGQQQQQNGYGANTDRPVFTTRGGFTATGGPTTSTSTSSHAPASFLPGMRDRAGGSLLILVPTVARRGVDYLTRTVDSLLGRLSSIPRHTPHSTTQSLFV